MTFVNYGPFQLLRAYTGKQYRPTEECCSGISPGYYSLALYWVPRIMIKVSCGHGQPPILIGMTAYVDTRCQALAYER